MAGVVSMTIKACPKVSHRYAQNYCVVRVFHFFPDEACEMELDVRPTVVRMVTLIKNACRKVSHFMAEIFHRNACWAVRV